MKILSLDVSSHIGWSILENGKLIEYGRVDVEIKDKTWPWGTLTASNGIAEAVDKLVLNNITTLDKIVIERPTGSSFRNSQNLLDWAHCVILKKAIENQWDSLILYVEVSQWRKKVNLRLTEQDKKHNKSIKKGIKILPLKGRVSKKHLSVRMVNEIFNLSFKLKDNDIADSILVGYSYFI